MTPQAEINTRYPNRPLKDQVAIVTGANSGIGEGVARYMSAAGAKVAVNYVVNPEAADAIVQDINAYGGKAIAVQGDVSKEADVQRMFAETIGQFGALDILINNAGLQRDSKIADMTLDQWNFVIGVNLTGQFLCAREAIRQFKKQGPRQVSASLG